MLPASIHVPGSARGFASGPQTPTVGIRPESSQSTAATAAAAAAAAAIQSPSSIVSPARSARPVSSNGGSLHAGIKRAIDAALEPESPNDSQWSGLGGNESRIGVKRACNECRQQKLKCNVSQDPFVPCDRCVKQKIDCRIDANFKRVGKRKKNAEMEHENAALHQQLVALEAENAMLRERMLAVVHGGAAAGFEMNSATQLDGPSIYPVPQRSSAIQELQSRGDAAEGLLDMRSERSPGPMARPIYRLSGFSISDDKVNELFKAFFVFYHPYMPLLNESRGPAWFHTHCLLLFWTIMVVAMRKHNQGDLLKLIYKPYHELIWSTIADNKQHYLVVKALATICAWPLPVESSSMDQTPTFCGIMVSMAQQIGLHRPSHAQDFERFKVEVRDDELRDRFYTWAACNIVAQRVSTGYGLPPNTLFDWTLTSGEGKEPSFTLPPDVMVRLKVEMFCNNVTLLLYSDKDDPVGLVSQEHKKEVTPLLDAELTQLEREIGNEHSVNRLYLLAARLHYHLSALFDPPDTREYRSDLDRLWVSTVEFVESACQIRTHEGRSIIAFATNYVFQMLLAAGVVIFKLLNSFYAAAIDRDYGSQLFSSVVTTIRLVSIMSNDLPARFAEVLAQLWQKEWRGTKEVRGEVDDTLQLKVRARMSMSLVQDSVWRWRHVFHVEGKNDMSARDAALNKRTNPDTAPLDMHEVPGLPAFDGRNGLAPPAVASSSRIRRSPTPGMDAGWGSLLGSNDVFDPVNWLFNGDLSSLSTYTMADDNLFGQSIDGI